MLAGDRLVMHAVRRNAPWTAILAATAVGGAAAELALPYMAGRTVDAFVVADPAAVRWLAGCAAVVACVVLCESLGMWAGGVTGARAAARLRLGMLRHVLGVGPAVTRRFPEGELVTRAGLNAEEVARAPESVTGALALLVPTAGALVALTLIAPVLTLTLLAGIVLILIVLNTFLRATTTIAGGYQEAQGELAAGLVEALGGARTIAAAGTEDREVLRVLRPLPRLRLHGMRLWRANATAGVRAGLVVPLVEVAVLAVGGFMLAAGDLTVGELYAAARYAVLGAALSGALGPIGGLARARAAAGRMAEVLAVPRTRHGSRALPSGTGAMEFRDVTAAGLTVPRLVIPGGSLTAVVGRSGSGKSLLAALAARMADPDRGTVLLDGIPLPELTGPELRRAVGCAFERPVLVGDTLADAITLGRPTPDDAVLNGGPDGGPDGVLDAVTVAARADGFVRRLPHGYATRTMDAPLSGGERQRLGLARAFAQGERLLVLDDATSSLDTVTEREIGRALADGPGGRTRLVVAHRLATAAQADQVVWLEDGAVRGQGPHRELWRDPAYRAVFQGEEP
ncbi:ABC transporter ATP-binding protein/permease [Nonomuraea glycinis]|uniref:ABC transporter ATP-binding protein n=1 Tax=Nonomuraea glycinis TaxID=2047744 RepID=A0A918E769_9ACTN|nr:ABC transporter ATP-binding protein [Nonomuraea glycinis]MCA2177437.1 ABC transporter ATP-binding protein/permease [Nonomuraea glycinis]GGP09297.1 ABC transporter ATP-binding protein [Nonomuraea glycinis]